MSDNNYVDPAIIFSVEELHSSVDIETRLTEAKTDAELEQILSAICKSSVSHFRNIGMKVTDINDSVELIIMSCNAVQKKKKTPTQFAQAFAPWFDIKYSTNYVFR